MAGVFDKVSEGIDMVGHATHFLKRLKRADDGQAELALQLYHQPQMVRTVLTMIAPQKEVERLALSISPTDKGPYVVVSRTGAFITCLGEGMKTEGLPVISFERLQTHLQRAAELQSRRKYIAEAQQEARPGYDIGLLLASKAHTASREDLLAVSALQPALKYDYLVKLEKYVDVIYEIEAELLRMKQIPKNVKQHFRSYWDCHFAVGHMLVVATMFGPQGLERFLDPELDLFPLYQPFRLGQRSFAARSIFASSKLGRFAVPVCKNHLVGAESPTRWLFGLLGLLAIGIRHAKLKPQVHRLIYKSFKENPTNVGPHVHAYQHKLGERFFEIISVALENEESLYARTAKTYQKILYNCAPGGRRLLAPYDFPSEEAVPEGLGYAFQVNLLGDIRLDPFFACQLAESVVWLARAEAEDLYLPRDLVKQIAVEWEPSCSEYLFKNLKAYYVNHTPAKARPEPGRNEPCPCGSGEKYKRCCLGKKA